MQLRRMTMEFCLWVVVVFVFTNHPTCAQSQTNDGLLIRGTPLTSTLGHKDVLISESVNPGDQNRNDTLVQDNFSSLLSHWSITVRQKGQINLTNVTTALDAEEHLLGAHLHQVIDVASRLVQISQECESGGGISMGNSTQASECPMMAQELLHGGALAFLASLLSAYPQGPSNSQTFVAWTAAATTFLQNHYRSQIQQRNATKQSADAAADMAAIKSYLRASRKVKSKNTEATEGGGALVGGDISDGSSDSSSDVEADDEEENGSRRILNAQISSRRSVRRSHQHSSRANSHVLAGASGSAETQDNKKGGHGDGDGDIIPHPALDHPQAEFPANFTGAKYGGIPLVRRVLLAQLLRGWMHMMHDGKSNLSATVAADVSRVVALLYRIHVESVAQRAIMEYFHISKAGGTSWTAAASLSGCRRPLVNAARFRSFDDDCRWINGTLMREHGIHVRRMGIMTVCSRFEVMARKTTIRDCAGRLRRALESGFQYISNEYTLHGGMHDMHDTHICPEFVNVISIREPLERLASNIKYMLVRLRATLFRKPPAADVFKKLFCNASAATWEKYSPPVVDNYNIRTMVGERAFHSPLYGIGEAHEAVAKQLLMQYDLVLDLNSGDSSSDVIMRMGLGWEKTLAEIRVWTGDRLAQKTGMDLDNKCRVGDLKPLFKRQIYDQRWYSFGRVLSRLDQLFLTAASQLGLRPWTEEWAQEVWGREGAAAASPDRELLGRCGLLGASQALRWGPLEPEPPQTVAEQEAEVKLEVENGTGSGEEGRTFRR